MADLYNNVKAKGLPKECQDILNPEIELDPEIRFDMKETSPGIWLTLSLVLGLPLFIGGTFMAIDFILDILNNRTKKEDFFLVPFLIAVLIIAGGFFIFMTIRSLIIQNKIKKGQWRRGIFYFHDTLLIQQKNDRCFLIPHNMIVRIDSRREAGEARSRGHIITEIHYRDYNNFKKQIDIENPDYLGETNLTIDEKINGWYDDPHGFVKNNKSQKRQPVNVSEVLNHANNNVNKNLLKDNTLTISQEIMTEESEEKVPVKKYDNVSDILDKIVDEQPHSHSKYYENSRSLKAEKNYEKALLEINKAIGLFEKKYKGNIPTKDYARDEYYDNLELRGEILTELERHKEALKDYVLVLEYEPESAMLKWNIASTLLALGRYGEAITFYDFLIKEEADEIWYYEERARALYETENYVKAIKDLNHFLKANPEPAAFTLKGKCLFGIKDYPKAKKEFQKALSKNPDDIEAQKWLNRCP